MPPTLSGRGKTSSCGTVVILTGLGTPKLSGSSAGPVLQECATALSSSGSYRGRSPMFKLVSRRASDSGPRVMGSLVDETCRCICLCPWLCGTAATGLGSRSKASKAVATGEVARSTAMLEMRRCWIAARKDGAVLQWCGAGCAMRRY